MRVMYQSLLEALVKVAMAALLAARAIAAAAVVAGSVDHWRQARQQPFLTESSPEKWTLAIIAVQIRRQITVQPWHDQTSHILGGVCSVVDQGQTRSSQRGRRTWWPG